MFTVYHSNQPKNFKNLLIKIMSDQSLSDPMQSEIIIVENKIVIEWIQIELAKYFGIASNIEFMSLSVFISEISSKILSNNFIMNDFNRSIMYWKFIEILSQKRIVNNYPFIKEYLLNDVDQRKCGQFSEKLVKLFSKYLIYRSDWLEIWKFNKTVENTNNVHQLWQSEIWRILLKYLKKDNNILYENINYLKRFLYLLKNNKKINKNFPKRIFIFGVISILPIYWKILKSLSNYIDIYFLVLSPCNNFYYNHFFDKNLYFLQSLDDINAKNIKKSKSFFSMNSGITISNSISKNINYKLIHPLLSFCDTIGKNIFYACVQLENVLEKKIYNLPKKNSLLHILQHNILDFQHYVIINDSKYNKKVLMNCERHILHPEDRSITFHVCHNIQREVEVLHDNILLMLQEDLSLLKKGIVVMAPNIYHYVAAINTVFNNMYGRNLPFIIASDHKCHVHPIALAFLDILNLPYSKCTFEEIFLLLKIPLISARFNMTSEEIKLLYQWIDESGIRWGLDEITLSNLNLSVINKNTWCIGFTRMLLGYAMRNQYNTWEGIFPYDNINEEYVNIIGQLGEFLQKLKKWRDRLSRSHVLTEWMFYIQEILEDFFCYSNIDNEDYEILSVLKSYWKEILESGIKSGYSEPVNVIILRDKLYYKLGQEKINYKFFPNSIIFCDITPTYCIPCEVICFLGMNGDVFPRSKVSFDFDLIEACPYNSDNNTYDKDCYSFLLAFLLAQKKIYISFIGYSICDGVTCDASILVHILCEYIARYFYLIGDKDLEININIDRIRNHLFQQYSCVPFAIENFISESKKQSFATEWMFSTNIDMNNIPFYVSITNFLPKIIINKISFYDLYNFYCHPIKAWFHQRLGVYFNQNILKSINNSESFSVSALHNFDLNKRLLHYLLVNNNDDVNIFYNSICASGILPYGAFGELYWIKQYSKMQLLTNQIKEYYLFEKFNLDIFLNFNNVTLTGQLSMVQKNGLIRWKPSYLLMKDVLLLWLEHLVYCSLGGRGDSRLFGVNSMWHFPNFSKLQAKEFLFVLISGYLSGINIPLLLFYKSGGEWINQVFDWHTRTISTQVSSQKKARYKLLRAWQGIKYPLIPGEYCDPYYSMLMSYDLSEKNITEIIETAKCYFLFPMRYRLIEQ